jgi:hypothetical protein
MYKLSFRSLSVALIVAALVTTQFAFSGTVAQTPDSPDGCTLSPVTVPLFDATPAAAIAATPATTSTVTEIDEAEIRDAIGVIVACINSSDAAYQYAIFTDRYLAEQLADPTQTYQPQFEQQLDRGETDSESAFSLVGVPEVSLQPNGMVLATILLSNGDRVFSDTVLLANVEGVWLIDSIEDFDPPR